MSSNEPLDSDLRPSKKLKTECPDDRAQEKEKLSKTLKVPKLNGDVDWRDDCLGVREINSYALKKKILTDVTFLVGDKLEVFEAHRLILAMSSPVFEAMFFGSLAEKGNSITIPDVEPEGFYHLLKFLYSERLSFADYNSAFKTAFAADKYCVTNLKERCKMYLTHCKLDHDNVWTFLENAIFLDLRHIIYKCLIYVRQHAPDCFHQDGFLGTSERVVEAVLTFENEWAIKESKLLDAVLRWAGSRAPEAGDETFRGLVMPLLKHVRFSLLKANEFVHFLEVGRLKEVLSDPDALLILKHIVQPSLCPLPDWCCLKLSRLGSKAVPSPSSSSDGVQEQQQQNVAFSMRCRLFNRSRLLPPPRSPRPVSPQSPPPPVSPPPPNLFPPSRRRISESSSSSSSLFSTSSSSSSDSDDDSTSD